jgi:hypothetical protein
MPGAQDDFVPARNLDKRDFPFCVFRVFRSGRPDPLDKPTSDHVQATLPMVTWKKRRKLPRFRTNYVVRIAFVE